MHDIPDYELAESTVSVVQVDGSKGCKGASCLGYQIELEFMDIDS